MKTINQTTEFSRVTEFLQQFQQQYPCIALNVDFDSIANWLAQPHWKMYRDNLELGIIDQMMFDRFMFGMFADWVLANNYRIDNKNN